MPETQRAGRFLAKKWCATHNTNVYLGFVPETEISIATYAVVMEHKNAFINFRVFDATMYKEAVACFNDVVNGVDLAICEEKDYG